MSLSETRKQAIKSGLIGTPEECHSVSNAGSLLSRDQDFLSALRCGDDTEAGRIFRSAYERELSDLTDDLYESEQQEVAA